MRQKWTGVFTMLGICAMAHAAVAAPCVKHSPQQRVALIELYTSQGCDSCPAADRWLSRLGVERGADTVVPLALHVDYWDRLGWTDRFAQPAFTDRQQMLARHGESGFAYTPGVYLDLAEFRPWNSANLTDRALRAENAKPPGADIRIELDAPGPAKLAVNVHFTSRDGADLAQAYVALYESGLVTAVAAGENRGATLQHDFVVREWRGPLDPATPFAQVFAVAADWQANNLGVAAFVTGRAAGEILQATALAVCAP